MRKGKVFGFLLLAGFFIASETGVPDVVHAQDTLAPPTARTIRVAGQGQVQVTPDRAHIDLAVETVGTTARAASEENARLMDRVIAALVSAGAPRGNIETRNYSIYPEYAPPMPTDAIQGEPRIRAYRASNMVSVEVQDLERVGGLIDAALAAGANRVDAVRFSLADPSEAQAEATRRAVAKARTSAEAIASALGVRLGAVLDASTSLDPVRPYPVPMMAARMESMEAAAPTPIQPGEQTVFANVSVVYAMEGGR